MPTPKKEKQSPIVIDGKVEAPINKRKLPPKVDWQARILEKKSLPVINTPAETPDEP